MYRIVDNRDEFLHVFVDQFSVVEDRELGFASFIGSRSALEEVRKKLVSPSWSSYIRFFNATDVHLTRMAAVYMLEPSCNVKYKFFYRKLEDSPFWIMTVMSVDAYNSCQDLARGMKITKSQRTKDLRGDMLSNYPITFVFKGSDLFTSQEEMDRFLSAQTYYKKSYLLSNTAFIDVMYQKLSMLSRIPMLREWMGPLIEANEREYFFNLDVSGFIQQHEDIPLEEKIFTFRIRFNEYNLASAIQRCFRENKITTGSPVQNGAIQQSNTLTGYLNQFGDNLVQRAHERFHPLYVPGVDHPEQKAINFFLNTKYYSDLDYYAAQQDVICAVARGLQKNKRTLVVGECGIGKTAIALASIYVHSKKKNPITMVMCPGHMVEEWNKEINRLYPFAQTHIIEKLSELEPYEDIIRNKKASSPLFLIFGKDSCKMDYEERPYMLWDSKRSSYITMDKHRIYPRGIKQSTILEKYASLINFFLKKNSKNVYAVKITNSDGKKYEKIYETREKSKSDKKTEIDLWTATSVYDTGEWVKLPKVGWVNTKLAKEFVEGVQTSVARGEQLSTVILKAFDIASSALSGETAKPLIRCNISDYIYRRMKNRIDYFIADEVHLYSSKDTAQGKAFTNMVSTAKHTVALTGTLLNGYAENIFSMLFKMYSRVFVRNGFSFNDARDFSQEYGVVERIQEYDRDGFMRFNQKTTTKFKPGVSPLLFSKFLLDKAVFVTLADITADLPNYQEIPLGITMDTATQEGYSKLVSDFRAAVRSHPDNANKFLFKTIQRMNLYPDQPYNQVPIFDNDTGEQILCPASIPRQVGRTYYSAKDQQLLKIVQKHKENGEKVLVYVHWVNRLDCVARIRKMLDGEGIKSAFLTASVSARERQKWIEQKLKEGIDVLICNPKLVETGLNLLDFTTIVFYQMDDQLFTMRQASRRSLRLNQSHDVTVYILYFKDTVQENILSLMANKLQAAMSIEGKFSEEGLNAIGDTDSILTQLANNLIKEIDMKLETGAFDFHNIKAQESGDRFKNKAKSIIHDWYYEVFQTKKKPKKVDLSCDLEKLLVG